MARFDLNLLGALDALLTEQNVTRAAEMLNVTQPTMSGMLQRLRYQFDDPILVRNGRGMLLTNFAASLVEPVREAIKGVGALLRAEPSFDPATSARTFTLMASDYCASMLVPRVVARLAVIAPRMRLVVHAPNAPVERIAGGDVELCITTDEDGAVEAMDEEGRLQCQRLFTDRLVCVVSDDHVLHEDAGPDAYFEFPHVATEGIGTPAAILAAHRSHVPDYRPAYVVSDFALIPYTVENTNAVGLVPERLAKLAARSLATRWFDPPIELPRTCETLRWHARHHEDAAHMWLRDILVQEAFAFARIGEHETRDLARRSPSRLHQAARGRPLVVRPTIARAV